MPGNPLLFSKARANVDAEVEARAAESSLHLRA